jgi:carboxyl-terminal processing protease
MRNISRILALFLIAGLAVAGPAEDAYVADALAIIQQNALAVGNVEWPTIRRTAMYRVHLGDNPHDVLSDTLKALGDGHSFLMRPPASKAMQAPVTRVDRLAVDAITRIGYVNVRGFAGTHGDSMLHYVRALREGIAASDACGYVIDLRRNGGGNMWPAMLGLQPLLGDGVVGGFRDRAGNVETWRIYADRATYGGTIAIAVRDPLPGNDKAKETPVAVLVGTETASAAEGLAIAFRGRANTRFYGWHTKGQTTANQGFVLADDARMEIAIADMIDRDGNAHRPFIEPDVETTAEIVTRRWGRSHDATREAATLWLTRQPGCAAS